MPKEILLYVDESGSRDPDRRPKIGSTDPNWFALGGVLLQAEDKTDADQRLEQFRKRWPEMGASPLHSYEIRNRTKQFRWLAEVSEERSNRFYEDLGRMMVDLPVFGVACVVDRPGYNHRYESTYGTRRWKLCRTAFHILVERVAKYAHAHDSRLRVFIERSDKCTEAQLKSYYDAMVSNGLPFDAGRSAKYQPLSVDALRRTLYEFRVKTKASDLMQVADLMLWPICKGGYEPEHRTYQELVKRGKLLDAKCSAGNGLLGIKYSCFDLVDAARNAAQEKQKPA